jgi:hypothetical protein
MRDCSCSVRWLHEHVFVTWRPPDTWSYGYLLGMYLGDGHVAIRARTTNLRITLDAAYPDLVDETVMAVQLAVPYGHVSVRRHPRDASVIVGSYAQHWPAAFPQHGAGQKHDRPIVLATWQRAILDADPRPFLRGLIHSDGCRVVNRFTTTLPSGRVAEYAYPRYFFSNLSADIRALFCEYCERLGIRWTQSNHRNISVAQRPSVALLDEFIGPKS